MWTTKTTKVPKLKDPILLSGLPGIGNVGKVVVDLLVDDMKATKVCSFFSQTLPYTVFVTEDNLVSLPTIELYYAKVKKQDFLFLVGDVQPTDEVSSYSFCETILDFLKKHKCKQIITLGGIGLQEHGTTPKVYCTGNSKKAVASFIKGTKINPRVHGVVGPIIGVTGLLLGLAKIDAVALLAETIAHPMYVGITSAREILKILDKKFGFNLDLKKLDQEIKELEAGITKVTKELSDVQKQAALKKLGKHADDAYIG